MAVGDLGSAIDNNHIEDDEDSSVNVSLEEQKDSLKSLLDTPLRKGEIW